MGGRGLSSRGSQRSWHHGGGRASGSWALTWAEPRCGWDGVGGLRPLWSPQGTSPKTLQNIPLRTPERMMATVNARHVSLSKALVQIQVPASSCSRSGKGQGLPLYLLCFWVPKLHSSSLLRRGAGWCRVGGWFFPSGCPSLRSVIVENASGQTSCTSTSELLKPMKKRKYREYQSPSEEESEPDTVVGRGLWGGKGEARCYPSIPTIPSINSGLGVGPEKIMTQSSFWGRSHP